VVEACRQAGLQLDVVGAGVGRLATRPEDLLGRYDIVFAKAKAAMEAMAVGTAVILCDFSGVGPMVRSADFDRLRPLNFGFEALAEPLRPEPLIREIARYDPEDATRVRDLIRSSAGLVGTVERLVAIYQEEVAEDQHRQPHANVGRSGRSSIRGSLFLRLYWRWMSIAPRHRDRLNGLPGIQLVRRSVRRLLLTLR
jgi:hypothetical protein